MKVLIENKVPMVMVMAFFAFLFNAFTHSHGSINTESVQTKKYAKRANILINYDK